MFRFVKSLTFWWPVTVREPDPDQPGAMVEQSFEAQFRLIDDARVKASRQARRALMDRLTPDMSAGDIEAIQDEIDAHDRAALAEVLADWRDICDGDGLPIPFSGPAFEELYGERRFRAALTRAYGEAIAEDGGRVKN